MILEATSKREGKRVRQAADADVDVGIGTRKTGVL